MVSFKTRPYQQLDPAFLVPSQAPLAQNQLKGDVSDSDYGNPREAAQPQEGRIKVDDQTRGGAHRSPNKQPNLGREFSGKLVFRTSAATHEQMAIIADRQGISINRWIEQSVQQALNHDPGSVADAPDDQPGSIASALIADPETSSKLFTAVQPHLAARIDIFRFADALKRFVLKMGAALEEIDPYLKPSRGGVVGFVCAVAELFDQSMRRGDL